MIGNSILTASSAFIEYSKISPSISPPGETQLFSACARWVARYEVFSVAQPLQIITSITVPLDSDEIWLNMNQSLWYGHLRPNGSLFQQAKVFKRDGSEPLCRIQFPIAISPHISTFMVLRDVFTIDPGQSELRKSYSTKRITFHFDSKFESQWNTMYYLGRMQNRLEVAHWNYVGDGIFPFAPVYLYFFTFSSDGSYLFFRDEEIDRHANLIILELHPTEPSLWSVAGRTTKHLPHGAKVSSAFQYSLPVALIVYDVRVYIWPFKSGKSVSLTPMFFNQIFEKLRQE